MYLAVSAYTLKKTEYFASVSTATGSFLTCSLFLFTQSAKNSSAQLSSALAEDWFCDAVVNKGQRKKRQGGRSASHAYL